MAKTYTDGSVLTFEAENSLATKQYYLVELGTSAGQVDLPDNDADVSIGVVLNKPAAGEEASVRMLNSGGSCWMVASAAIAVGAEVCAAAVATAAGKIRTMTGIGAGTYRVVGIALEVATNDGDIIEVMLIPAVQRVVS